MSMNIDYLNQMKEMLKDDYDSFISSYDRPRVVGLRVNTNKITVDDFKKLYYGTLSPIDWCKTGFYYDQNDRPGKHIFHDMGLYYIQEPSAMTPVVYLEPNENDIVLDLCSAPGGKATEIADMMHNEGLLISNEIVSSRCKILSENIERLSVKNTIVTNHSPEELESLLPNFFTKILVDTPCSGEGMFIKNDNAMDEWSIENTKICSMRALKILESADKMLKNGGKLVFSTCTFNLTENEGTIVKFLETHPSYEITKVHKFLGFADGYTIDPRFNTKDTVRLFPHKIKGEGHFIAILTKNGEPTKCKVAPFKQNCKVRNVYKSFEKENLNINLDGNFVSFGDELYLLPENTPDISKIKIYRAGLDLGSVKKDRFEPSHSLALYLKANECKNAVSISHDEATKYIAGNTIEKDTPNGWCLLTCDGYSLAWGKASNGIIKNHYPKCFRK